MMCGSCSQPSAMTLLQNDPYVQWNAHSNDANQQNHTQANDIDCTQMCIDDNIDNFQYINRQYVVQFKYIHYFINSILRCRVHTRVELNFCHLMCNVNLSTNAITLHHKWPNTFCCFDIDYIFNQYAYISYQMRLFKFRLFSTLSIVQ